MSYALGTESTYLNQIRGIERGNQIGYNMYAGNISPPVAWTQQQVDLYPYAGDPKFINPYTSDFLSNLSSNPNWDEVVQYLSKSLKSDIIQMPLMQDFDLMTIQIMIFILIVPFQ